VKCLDAKVRLLLCDFCGKIADEVCHWAKSPGCASNAVAISCCHLPRFSRWLISYRLVGSKAGWLETDGYRFAPKLGRCAELFPKLDDQMINSIPYIFPREVPRPRTTSCLSPPLYPSEMSDELLKCIQKPVWRHIGDGCRKPTNTSSPFPSPKGQS
jgi:hypothetical protein